MTRFEQRVYTAVWLIFWQTSSVLASEKLPLQEVVQGMFVFQGPHEQMRESNQGSIGNSGFIVGKKAVAVIDPGGSLAFGERFKAAIREVTDLPIEFLIFTHFHPDHVAGAAAFDETRTIIAHENYLRAMVQRAQFYVDRFPDILLGTVEKSFRVPTQSVQIGKPIELDLGERVIVVEAHSIAHTDNDVTVVDEKTNSLWASDLVFAQRTPSLDGSLNGWLQVLAGLDEREYGLTVPGHGSPAMWKEIVKPQRNYFSALREAVRKQISDGVTLSAALKEHDERASYESSWRLYAMQHGSNIAKAFVELEWE